MSTLERRGDFLVDRGPRRVATTAFPRKRMIVVLWSDAKSDRYALHRFADGAVAWRGDAFTAPEDPAEPERWIAYRGELTVAEVIERVPDAAVSVLTWTRAEIESGVEAAHLDAPRARERRAESLDRLGRELESVTG